MNKNSKKNKVKIGVYAKHFKSAFDFTFAFLAVIFLSPVFLVCILLLIVNNRGSIFFVQERPGKDAISFKILKFKTMNDNRNKNGDLLHDKERLTAIGRIIRKLSLDEIPQLFNVIKGEMSLVGPRPLLVDYLPMYTPSQKKRHLVKPGITGWAQVNGRNAISWQKKFEYDTWYVENLSFALDLKIIFRTIIKVLKREGVSSGTHVTVEKFNGSN